MVAAAGGQREGDLERAWRKERRGRKKEKEEGNKERRDAQASWGGRRWILVVGFADWGERERGVFFREKGGKRGKRKEEREGKEGLLIGASPEESRVAGGSTVVDRVGPKAFHSSFDDD